MVAADNRMLFRSATAYHLNSLNSTLTGNTTEMTKNPFQEEHYIISSAAFPNIASWAYPILIAFAIWRVFVMLTCVAIFMIPIQKGPASRKRHLWLLRRRYHGPMAPSLGNGVAFLVPNKCMVLALSEFLCNGFYLALACVNYEYYKQAENVSKFPLSYWYGIAWLPSYIGIWVAGWALCYTCLCDLREDGRSKAITRVLNPFVFNSIWLTWSFFSFGVNVYWAIASLRAERTFNEGVLGLLKSLSVAAAKWDFDRGVSKGTIAAILVEQDVVREGAILISRQVRSWAITWVVLGCVLAVFYVFTLRHLLKMSQKLLTLCNAEALTCRKQLPLLMWTEVRRELCFLFKSCVIIVCVLCAELGLSCFQIENSSQLKSPTWRTTSAIVAQLPGLIMSPVLLFQSWRIFSEHSPDELGIQEAHEVPRLPGFASQLLGWTTATYPCEKAVDSEMNFPGLCLVKPEECSSEEGYNSTSTNLESFRIFPLDVKVTRSTTISTSKM